MKLVWGQGYGESLLDTDISYIRSGCTPSTLICLAAGQRGSINLNLIACGNCHIITAGTQPNSPVFSGLGWWYYGSGSIGFSLNSNISQNPADTLSMNDPYRLSWNIGSPGYRVGSTIVNDNSYTKYVLMYNGNLSNLF